MTLRQIVLTKRNKMNAESVSKFDTARYSTYIANNKCVLHFHIYNFT